MIQMAAAFSSLVNGGYYYQPHVVREIVSDSGATIKSFDKLLVRQTVSKQTSEFIQKYMYQTVEAGTAGGAKVEGYSIGGKTGTAQKLPREAKTYVVSFLGCAPAINPEIVIYVVVDEPQNVEKQADSSIATKFAGRILNEILPVLGIYPEGEIDYLLPTQVPVDPAEGETEPGQTHDNQTPDTETQDTQAPDTQTDDLPAQNDTQDQNSDIVEGEDNSGTEDIPENTSPDDQEDTNPGNNPDEEGTITENEQDNQDNAQNPADDEFNPDALD
jgi:stage V sporulation protein D (sporulation-specific penicillin-binding protein)